MKTSRIEYLRKKEQQLNKYLKIYGEVINFKEQIKVAKELYSIGIEIDIYNKKQRTIREKQHHQKILKRLKKLKKPLWINDFNKWIEETWSINCI